MKRNLQSLLPALVLVFCHHLCIAQNKELDSLSLLLKNAADSTQVNILKRMVFIWSDINEDSALTYISKLKDAGNRLNNPGAIIYADVKLAELYNYQGNFAAATKINTANLSFAEQKGTAFEKADVYKTIAMSYSMQQRNDSALNYYLKALKVYEQNNNTLNMAKVMVNMAVVYDNTGDYQKAVAYCSRAKDIFKDQDRNAYLVTLTNLALYQTFLGRYDTAESNYAHALQIAKQAGNYNSQAHIYSGLTDLYYRKKEYASMLPVAAQFEKTGQLMQNDYVMLRSKLSMGKAMFFNSRFNEAENYFTNALQMSDRLEDNQLLKDVYGMYSYLLLKKGNIREFDLYRQKIDSLILLENKEQANRAAKDLEAQYETEKKDNQIKLQSATIRQKQLVNYLLAGAVTAIALIAFISFLNYRNKQKLAANESKLQQQKIIQLEQENQLVATQAVMKGQDDERSRLAKDLHDGLGGMLSGVKFSFSNMKENMIITPESQQAFARNMDMLDGIVHELRRLAHNMMPESLVKFGLDSALKDMCDYLQQSGALKINYHGLGLDQAAIDQNIAINIYRIVQELLNNTIKHAKATEAFVQVGYRNGLFTITVEDNGAGFDTSAIDNNNREQGMGWSNIRNRVAALKGTIDVQSFNDKGTSVFIELNTNA